MLTRLKVNGFKNLVDVDVRFGPFTCIAGANGVGKSNLFDAIHFLSALANSSFIEAAQSVRETGASSIRNLFHRIGNSPPQEMSFEAEMILPPEGVDDLDQPAKATSTFVRYSVSFAYRVDEERSILGSLELLKEELAYIKIGEVSKHLLFPYSAQWRSSAVLGKRFAPFFISTEETNSGRQIKLHQDSKGDTQARGRTLSRLAANLPRTVLSTISTNENPTALLARREMESWRLLQLEPSALRKSDAFTEVPHLQANGSRLAATLYRLARLHKNGFHNGNGFHRDEEQVYSQIANRLSALISDVRSVSVDRNEIRELLTLQMTGLDGTTHPAQALSDGTLRFLALAVLELDPTEQGVICLEEPENGIHPARIPAMLKLLQDIATDAEEPVDNDNPLRQVIINTHSPSVVLQIPQDSLIVAELREKVQNGQRFKRAVFSCIPDTWREKAGTRVIAFGELLAYLNPIDRDKPVVLDRPSSSQATRQNTYGRRVIDNPKLQPYLPLWEDEG